MRTPGGRTCRSDVTGSAAIGATIVIRSNARTRGSPKKPNRTALSVNQPTPDPSQEGSTRFCPFPSWEGVRGGFMVAVHGKNGARAVHEAHKFQVRAPMDSSGARLCSKTLVCWSQSLELP